MDKIKDLAGKASGGGKSGSSTGGGAPAGQDYGDKGLAAIEKQTGMKQSDKTNEMITDKGRDFVEKQSGKDIPAKFSN